jgi:hypothetical protein
MVNNKLSMVIPSPRALGSMLIYWRVDVPNYPHVWKHPRSMGIDAWNFQQKNMGLSSLGMINPVLLYEHESSCK